MDRLDLSSVPIFCAHEHWGSVPSQFFPEGLRADWVRGATPLRRTGVVDILVECYFGWCLSAAGVEVDELSRTSGAKDLYDLAARSPIQAMEALRGAIRDQQMTGTYQCIRRGIIALYGVDISRDDDRASIELLDNAIAENYSQVFDWYETAMAKAYLSTLIRPVQPEYYAREQSAELAAREASFTKTVLREFIGRLFDIAAKGGGVDIKQMQAYRRSLEFKVREDSEVRWSGDMNEAEVRVFED